MPAVNERKLQRALLQEKFGAGVGLPPSADDRESISLSKLMRGDELLFVLPDGERHERRVQRAILSGADRLFWATITVACGSPGGEREKLTKRGATLAKQYGHLAKARNDLNAYYQYYRPMMLGDLAFVGVPPGLGKSAGFFDHAIRLDNPRVDDLRTAILQLREWLDINQDDPEYTSFQLNFAFSGHGDRTTEGAAALVFGDQTLAADELASMLLWTMPKQESKPAPCRLDLFLDCCHSGAIAQSLSSQLIALQKGVDLSERSHLELGQVYCACLGDEKSFELKGIPHSLFTFAFLNECSRRRPEGAEFLNLPLRDIGWVTKGKQHPMLLDFTVGAVPMFKFPPMYYLTRGPKPKGPPSIAADVQVEANVLAADPVGIYLRMATAFREQTREVESEIANQPELRVEYSREELLTNKRFPFL